MDLCIFQWVVNSHGCINQLSVSFLASFFSIFFMPERKVWVKTESALSNKLQTVSHIRMIYMYDRKI